MDRPTFHESWHRVADLRPRLRPSVRITRQFFRGRRWHVIEDPASGQFYRLTDAGYDLVGRLDGSTTVDRAWHTAMERLGDEALTQGETIGLLGQLYRSNLIRAEVTGDSLAVFQRQRERQAREFRGYLQSLLFLRIPLFDPDPFLTRWAPLVSWVFGPIGLIAWLALLGVAAGHVIGRGRALLDSASGVLAAENLLLLYATYAVIKLVHELGHGFACKVFGARNGTGGEVHTLGLMFLVLVPLPYVDATSSWAFRSRLQRIVVSAAGILVELACAAIAAIVWARSAPGTAAHGIAYNAMFIASVSTILFNGNPLLRYDAYYVLSDALGVPNLGRRSTESLKFLVKKFAWGVRGARNPARDPGETPLLLSYGIASTAYRVIVYLGIALFIASQQLLLGAVLLLFGLAVWIVVPLGKLLRYLLLNPELARTRSRAIATSLGSLLVLGVPAATVPVPDHVRAQGVAEPGEFEVIYAEVDGFLDECFPSGGSVEPDNSVLARQSSDRLARDRRVLEAQLDELRASRSLAFRDDPARAFQIDRQIDAVTDQLAWVRTQEASLVSSTSKSGQWIAPDLDRLKGGLARRGQGLGMVADLSEMRVRIVLDQRTSALVIAEERPSVEIRARNRPQQFLRATVERVLPAGQRRLPSAALGIAGGGTLATAPDDQRGVQTAEDIFEAWLTLPADHGLLPGQRVIARFELQPRPLLEQGLRAVRQVLQERFRV